MKKYSPQWLELESALNKKKPPHKAGVFLRLSRLDMLYRSSVRNLSYAKTHFPASETTIFLNSLVSRAHNSMYRESRKASSFFSFFIWKLPALLRKTMPFTGLAALFFFGAALYAFIFCLIDVNNARAFLPEEYLHGLNYEGVGNWDATVVSSEIMTNNIRVCILAFAFGVTLGIGSAYVMIQNGFILGALAALFARAGRSLTFWSLILPHGIIELFAIFISGGAAFMIGWAVIRPGEHRRADSLIIGTREAVQLLGAMVPMLIIAGIIEGFFTPANLPAWVKLIFAAGTALLLAGYCLIGLGRKQKTQGILEY